MLLVGLVVIVSAVNFPVLGVILPIVTLFNAPVVVGLALKLVAIVRLLSVSVVAFIVDDTKLEVVKLLAEIAPDAAIDEVKNVSDSKLVNVPVEGVILPTAMLSNVPGVPAAIVSEPVEVNDNIPDDSVVFPWTVN